MCSDKAFPGLQSELGQIRVAQSQPPNWNFPLSTDTSCVISGQSTAGRLLCFLASTLLI